MGGARGQISVGFRQRNGKPARSPGANAEARERQFAALKSSF